VLGPPLNVYRLCLHPEGLARRTTNFTEWATYLLEQLRRSITLTGDSALMALRDEVTNYANVAQIAPLLETGQREDRRSWCRSAWPPRSASCRCSRR
jgi:hypothetical protein